jgi:RimJ/RimL family protein N-acetyltransferase
VPSPTSDHQVIADQPLAFSPAAPGWVRPVVLSGRQIRLEPLSLAHIDDLSVAGADPSIWALTTARPTDRTGIEAWVRSALVNAAAGAEAPFATVDLASGKAVGSTRFMSIVPEHRRLEIGWTWVALEFQRSGANREAKLLQLTHAFEDLGANRVEFKTDARNDKSRNALLGIGATFEGIFRSHVIMPTGPLRNSAYYSVIATEWPAVKAHLRTLLERP